MVRLFKSVLLGIAVTSAAIYPAFGNTPEHSPNALSWLEKMSKAFKQTDYQGVFVHGQKQNLETFSIAHSTWDGVERERLSFLNGPRREILREGGEITCAYANDKVVKLKQGNTLPFASEYANHFRRLAQHYNLHMAGADRIAGYKVNRLDMMPKDRYRFGYRLWLLNDSRYPKQQGMLIRSEMVDSNKETLELFQFTQLELNKSIPAEWFKPNLDMPNDYQPLEAEMGVKPVPWYPAWIPGGFMKSNKMVAEGEGKRNAERLVFTDGLTTFTIFVEPLKSQKMAPNSIKKMGATVALMTTQRFNNRNHMVTVVGEVPIATAERVAQSIQIK